MKSVRWAVCALVLLFSFPAVHCHASAAPRQKFRIAVVRDSSPERLLKEWQATAQYLSNACGADFEIVPAMYGQLESLLDLGAVEYFISDPVLFVQMEKSHGVRCLATRECGDFKVKEHAEFGGAVLVRRGRADMNSLLDLRGKRVAAVNEYSLGGWLAVARELAVLGMDPRAGPRSLEFLHDDAAIVRAVMDGTADAGCLDSGVLERITREGGIDLSKLKVLPPPGGTNIGGFPYAVSTRLYPEWVFARAGSIDRETAEYIARALFDMRPEDLAAVAAGYASWTLPANYDPVVFCLQELRVRPFQDFGKITVAGTIRQYGWWISGIIFMLAGMSVAIVIISRLNVRLRSSRLELEAEISRRRKDGEELFKLASIVRNSSEIVSLVEPGGRMIFLNDAGAVALGVDPERVSEYSVTGILEDDSKDMFKRDAWPILMRGSGWEGDLKLRNISTGAVVEVHSAVFPIKDPQSQEIRYFASLSADISARKAAERQIAAINERLEYLLESSPGVFYSSEARGEFRETFVSQNITRLLGYSIEEVVGRPRFWTGHIHPEDSETVIKTVSATLADGISGVVEYRFRHKDGVYRWLRDEFRLIKDDAGQPMEIIGFCTDITRRKESEEALHESRERYYNLFKNSLMGIFQCDLEGRFLRVNAACARMFGFPGPEELLAKVNGIVPVYMSPEEFRKRLDELERREVLEDHDMKISRADGPESWVTVNVKLSRDSSGKPLYIDGIVQDISDRKAAVEELKWKTAFLEAQVESSLDGVLVVDRNSRRILINQRLIDMWYLPQAVLDDQNDETLLRYALSKVKQPDEFLSDVRHLYGNHLETSRKEVDMADGRVFDMYSSPVVDLGGTYYGRIWMFRDITQSKKMEEELRSKVQELEAFNKFSVDRELRMVELKETIRELEKKNPPAP